MIQGTHLFLKGVLYLSLQHPVETPLKNSELWISDPQVLDVQALQSKILLYPKKTGSLFINGLQSNSLQKIIILTSKDFQVFKKCSTYEFINFSEFPFIFNGSTQNIFHCPFEKLSLNEKNSNFFSLKGIFLDKEKTLRNKGLEIISSRWENGRRKLILSGDPKISNYVLSTLYPLQSFYDVEFTQTQSGNTIIFEVTLFEFSRKKAIEIGAHWPQQIRIQSLDSSSFASAFKNLPIGADFGESLGIGKILAQPIIRSKAGHKANFQSGGQIPISEKSLTVARTDWKDYGLLLEITPQADLKSGQSELSLDLKLEISEPDFGQALNGIPSIMTRKLSSHFDVKCGETTILSSMISRREGQLNQGLAWTQNIPLLKFLFGNESSLNSQSELWFAIKAKWEEISKHSFQKLLNNENL